MLRRIGSWLYTDGIDYFIDLIVWPVVMIVILAAVIFWTFWPMLLGL